MVLQGISACELYIAAAGEGRAILFVFIVQT